MYTRAYHLLPACLPAYLPSDAMLNRERKKEKNTKVQPTTHPHQFHVLLDAVNTGGFHCNFSASMTLCPLIFSFSFCRSLCSMMASVRTITWWFF